MRINKIKKKELLRFLVGGGSAVATDYIIFKGLLYAGIDISISKAFSYICGAAVGFIINKFWTFESKFFSKAEIIKYISLYAISACLNTAINKLIIVIVDMQTFAFLCATGTSMVINFLGQKFFVFSRLFNEEVKK